ncbi:MAG: NAD(P)-dependent glycerol-3-phosphate dehydrogenase [Alphaproteobacteria bacterium]|nr:NAD(P)-dependent glycerol-3-phosphate dehydrogenase [Alphaproteobacteria bacterium]
MDTIGIIGGGAWGTALAQVLSRGGKSVLLWAREPEVVSAINARHENPVFLPGIKLDENLTATGDIKKVAQKDILLLVVPTQFLRTTLGELKNDIGPKPVVICCKGVELNTGLLPSEIAENFIPKAQIAILTGPTFAAESAAGFPFAVTLAAQDLKFAANVRDRLAVKNFRLYAADDMTGAQLGAALKNVIAIACGIVHGKKLGENARAAIIARGLAEIARLTEAMGGNRETLMGLCGIGDLTLTCSSMQSRNFSLGAAIGEGQSADEILGSRKSVTEGVYPAGAALELAGRYGVELPITSAVYKCIEKDMPVDSVIEELLNRPAKEER